LERKYQEWIAKLEQTSPDKVGPIADELRQLIRQVPIPEEIVPALGQFGAEARFMVRSSSNLEDLAESAGAGLYESIPNVRPADVPTAVREVWSSLWTRRAAICRRQAGIGHDKAHMAVLVQTMLAPEFSFVIHTVNPLNQNRQEVYAEVVVGLGETLVSGNAHGTPYRLVSEKATGKVQTLAFANFSRALRPAERGVAAQAVDYSRVQLSTDSETRAALARRLASAGKLIEEKFGGPQDIEGAILDNEVWIVQTRPQQGLTSK
jgi:phosphoglucan,water dikinase